MHGTEVRKVEARNFTKQEWYPTIGNKCLINLHISNPPRRGIDIWTNQQWLFSTAKPLNGLKPGMVATIGGCRYNPRCLSLSISWSQGVWLQQLWSDERVSTSIYQPLWMIQSRSTMNNFTTIIDFWLFNSFARFCAQLGASCTGLRCHSQAEAADFTQFDGVSVAMVLPPKCWSFDRKIMWILDGFIR